MNQTIRIAVGVALGMAAYDASNAVIAVVHESIGKTFPDQVGFFAAVALGVALFLALVFVMRSFNDDS